MSGSKMHHCLDNGVKQAQLPQMLFITLVLHILHQIHCSSLDTLQHLDVLFVRSPKLNTGLEVQPHQCWVRGQSLSGPADQTIADTNAPIQAMISQFLQENTVGDGVKGITEVQAHNIHSLFAQQITLSPKEIRLVKHDLPFTNPYQLALVLPCDGTQHALLHDLPWHQAWADRPVVPWILLPHLLVDE
ncbi:hypothetical protein BTVI_157823 [Pitangus sulphuratus]|nr:hypothetical protein BTVI_157823 [Pitangus sulphuratus]